jgi:signal transduction histidine kinase
LYSGVYYIYIFFITPKSKDEDSKRRERILNIILSASVLLFALLNILILYNRIRLGSAYEGAPQSEFIIIFSIFLGLLILSRKGFHVAASYILVSIYFAAITYATFYWGPDLPSALLGYALVITVSSILISTRFAFVVTTIISIIIIALTYLQGHFLILPKTEWKLESLGAYDGIGFAAILFIIMTISWLSNREIERSLRRARNSEAALKEQRDLLEITVGERTKELQSAQAEKIDQLYRFAEFGRLASGLFHDLMNPLTSVSLYLEKLNSANPVEIEQTKEYLNKAFEASKRIERFTQAIRKQLQHRPARELFSVNEGIKQALQLVGHKAAQAQVRLNFDPAAEITTYDNPLKFHQVLVNLLSNAIDSYHNLPLDSNHKREVHITLTQAQNQINLTIQDWGCGITDEVKDKIFQPFYTTKTTEQGIGIGLSTTKEIIERDFHGAIEFQSTPGQGTIFHITFSRHDPASEN